MAGTHELEDDIGWDFQKRIWEDCFDRYRGKETQKLEKFLQKTVLAILYCAPVMPSVSDMPATLALAMLLLSRNEIT